MRLIPGYLKLSILIIFSLLLLGRLPAQNFEETIKFADDEFNSGNLTTALKSYQRALFFSEGRENLHLFMQIAEISYLTQNYESAQKYFGLAYDQSGDDNLKTELLFKKASSQMLNKNFQFAIIDLLSVNDTDRVVQKRLNFYLGTCYFGLEDFSKSRSCFEYCVEPEDKKALADLFSDKKLLSPSPRKARIMSMILPGLGQTYSGDLKAGFNSLALTSALIALGINISVKYQPVDAIITILPWYQRYYTGGFGKAEEIAAKRRNHKRNKVYTSVVELISEDKSKK